jgi:hypothetical protein
MRSGTSVMDSPWNMGKAKHISDSQLISRALSALVFLFNFYQ